MTKPDAARTTGDEPADSTEASPHVPAVRSEELLRGARELRIVHGSETYRLLVTRNNRLILQK
jgi:hemin uptake protein HemP